MRVVILFCCACMALSVWAGAKLPSGCKSIAVAGESLTLKTKKGTLVFMKNITNADLWITHPVSPSDASAGWTSRLQSDNWSALAVNKTTFVLNCIESRPGHEQQIPCEGAVAVCQWPHVKIPDDLQGNTIWAAEDKALAALTTTLTNRGFVLQ